MTQPKSRREFLSDTFSVMGGVAAGATLSTFSQRTALGEDTKQKPELRPVADETTGLPLLKLPEGFRYLTYGWAGDPMDGDQKTPRMHDGMGVITQEGDLLTLCRNHEINGIGKPIGVAQGQPYDNKARGGCTNLVFDVAKGAWVRSFGSIAGTVRNCAGGVTPWGTWLTCEETMADPADGNDLARYEKDHGWVFEVPADGSATGQPIKEMGRFVHEAVAVDRETGYVYLTEDQGSAGFYRYLPNEPGNMIAGGTLQVAEVVGQSDLRGGFEDGISFDVKWHKVPNPAMEPSADGTPADSVYRQGRKAGGSKFARLEGCWSGNGLIYFDATSGGGIKSGQIWQYDPREEKLVLLYESRDKRVLNMPDNLCVSPQGGLILCEDNNYAGEDPVPQRLLALTKEGHLRNFAENHMSFDGERGLRGTFYDKEWAGSTFSPDGQWLFANIQTPGITFAITGPWEDVLVQ